MIPYIINAGLILTGCLAFYKLLLQRETFYKLNRYILVICLIISFSLPLLPVPQQLSFRKAETVLVPDHVTLPRPNETFTSNTTEPAATQQQTAKPAASSTISFQQVMTWLVYLYWFGVIVFALNFLAQVVVLLYRAYTRPAIIDGPFRIVEISGDKAPCSFGNNIFINPEKYDWDTYNQILLHEKVHIRQGHSLDILFAELVLIFQWFNPFAWLYRKEVESNLEFLTDDHLVQRQEVEKSSYQLSLLKVSTPHFPLSLTTNYNQSLLKKRIVMMNAKKSNVHTAWKYFFLLPLLVLFAAVLNKPTVYANQTGDKGGDKVQKTEHKSGWSDIDTEGVWFATIKNNKISFHFKRDDEENGNSFNGTTFDVSEFSNLPRGQSGSFSLTREAGTMHFTGKFEGNEGMGRYKFTPDQQYAAHMNSQGIGKLNERDLMTFFFVDVKRSYLQMLKSKGFDELDKDDLVPLAALKVTEPFINSMRSHFRNLEPHDFVTLKALNITAEYVKEIQDAGYKDISANKIITFKAQGIDKEYLAKMKSSGVVKEGDDEDAEAMVALKALNIETEYINSFKAVGWNLSAKDAIPLKSLGVTPDFVKNLQDMGFKNLSPTDVLPFKAQNITLDYINSFKAVGFNNLSPSEIIPMKALGVTADYVKSFQDAGYTHIRPSDMAPLKSQGITPQYIKEYEALGFKNIQLSQMHVVKALNVTPAYITSMKEKGFNYNSLDKYVQLKSITD
ncbi:MAG TPA: M56 family metallopeptidase [Chitinophagaceae bacterium]|nr:M56 family metallopeptidase [Chitinophagaceae bacterium]